MARTEGKDALITESGSFQDSFFFLFSFFFTDTKPSLCYSLKLMDWNSSADL